MSSHQSVPESAEPLLTELSLRARRKYSKREQIRIFLRNILSHTWQPLWRATRRFDKAWYALVLGGALAFGQMSHSTPSHAISSGIVASYNGSGTLLIEGTVGDDQIVLTVENGNLKVNGSDPNTGQLSSAEVVQIVTQTYAGADTADYSALRSADFAQNAIADTTLGDGDDTLILSPDLPNTEPGGNGYDTLKITADGEIVYTNNRVDVNGVRVLNTFNGVFEQAILFGGSGDDTLNAANTSSQVTLNGGGGNDTLTGPFHGPATFQVSPGNDELYNTSSGRVELTADSDMTLNNAGITWGANTSTFNGMPEVVLLTGGAGNNTINASNYASKVQLDGAGGDDTLIGGSGETTFTGGAGADTVTPGAGPALIIDPSVADGDRLNMEGVYIADAQVIGDTNKIIWTAAENQPVPYGIIFNGLFSEVSLSGTADNNIFRFADYAGRTLLNGLDGDDTLSAGQGGGILDGGAGNDTLNGNIGADEFHPGAGTNSLADSTADDGDTIVYTGSGDITLGATTLTTADGSSTLNGFFEAALLTGDDGANVIDASGFSGSVTLRGRGGDDTLVGASGDDTLDGGAGNDTVVQQADGIQSLTDTQLTGRGTDALSSIERAELTGGAGADTLDASGFSGDVILRGLGGDDTLRDGSGDDTLEGGEGNDTIFVSLGNDTVDAGAGDDRVERSAGTPAVGIQQTADNDTLDGGAGFDTLVQQADGTQILTDTQLTGPGVADISNFEAAELSGGSGDDTIDASGFSGDVTLRGLDGNDTLIGSQGDSVIEGGAGEDTITSGAGENTIDGGPDIDTIDGVVEGAVEPEEFKVYIPLIQR